MSEADIEDIRRRFKEVHGGEPAFSPLYQEMIRDLKAGRRTKVAIVLDLNEAEAHRGRQTHTR